MRWRRSHQPTPPEGVRIQHLDGTVTPCEIFYVGVEGGMHCWEVTIRFQPRLGDHLAIDVLPPQTMVKVIEAQPPTR